MQIYSGNALGCVSILSCSNDTSIICVSTFYCNMIHNNPTDSYAKGNVFVRTMTSFSYYDIHIYDILPSRSIGTTEVLVKNISTSLKDQNQQTKVTKIKLATKAFRRYMHILQIDFYMKQIAFFLI